MSSAGQVGGAVSPISLLSLKVSSKPNPLGPSGPVNLAQTHTINLTLHNNNNNYIGSLGVVNIQYMDQCSSSSITCVELAATPVGNLK